MMTGITRVGGNAHPIRFVCEAPQPRTRPCVTYT